MIFFLSTEKQKIFEIFLADVIWRLSTENFDKFVALNIHIVFGAFCKNILDLTANTSLVVNRKMF